MTDQCKHCTVRGDYKKCLNTECARHIDWINKMHVQRIEDLEKTLVDISNLPAYRNDEAHLYALNILAQKPVLGEEK